MTGEIRNPAKLPTDLYPAEEKFARCLAEGRPCKIRDGELPKKAIESGEGANMVRGEVIRFFAYGGNEENPVSGPIIPLLGAWISGELNLMHASIPCALLLSHCHFDDFVRMQYAECAGLYLNGSRLVQGLSASGLTTKGDVNLRQGFSVEGQVRLVDANVGRNLDCMGGKFHNPKGYALVADRLTTKGSVILRNDFSAEGEVRLVGANIGGDLDCSGGKFHNSGRDALVVDGLMTKGNVNLRQGFSAEGEVRLLGASISGNLSCEDGKFHNPGGNTLNAEGSNIKGGLLWRKITCEGAVHLAYAKTDVLADDSDSWESCKVILDGFIYNRFVTPMDVQSRIDWLAKRPDGIGFSPLPYEQAAKVLFGMGHARDAREILLEKERQQTADKRTPPFRKFWRELWDIFSGYGYRLRYTAAWMSFFVFIGAFIFWFADESGCIVPNRPIVLANSDYNNAVKGADRQSKCPDAADRPTSVTKRLFPDYPEFNAFVYSLDVFIPVFALHQEPNWHPGPCLNRDLTLRFLSWWHWLEIIAGWILTSLLLLSVTGLLRPRQSSGERD